MPCVSLCPVERSADLIKEGLTTIHSHAIHQEKIIKELREQLKLSEDKVKELQKEQDDYDDLVPDEVECETFAWIEDRLGKMDVMEEELAKYEEDPEKLCATMDDHVENYLDDQGISLSLEELCEAYHDLKTSLQTTENYWKSKFEAVEQSTESSAYQEEEIKRLQEENKELQEKVDSMESEVLDAQDSYALQKQTEQVYYHGEPLMCIEDGTPITISDVFPNKFIKENKLLNEAYTKSLKRKNWEQSERNKLRKEIKELREQLKLKEDKVKDINGKQVKVPSEEELKVLGVSREDFIMLAQKSDCDYSKV